MPTKKSKGPGAKLANLGDTPKPAANLGDTPKPAANLGDTPKPAANLGDTPKPPVAVGESSKAPVVAGPPLSPSPSGQWRNRGLMIAGAAAIGVVGLLIGRASSSVPPLTPPPSASAQPSGSSALAEPLPPHFDLAEDPKFKAGIALRPMDHDIFDKLTTLALDRSQMRDVFPDRPYRVHFIGSLAEKRIGLVMVDLNRDGKVDERWDIKSGEVVRNVQADPHANGVEVRYTLAHGRWQPH